MTRIRTLRTLPVLFLGGAILLAACDSPEQDPVVLDDDAIEHDETEDHRATYSSVQEVLDAHPDADAAALMRGVGESQAEGYVVLRSLNGELQVSVQMTGLQPGMRGFHAHEEGSCEPGDDGAPAGAAGGHFAPFGHPHGAPDDEPQQRHVGDFGNLNVASDGTVDTSFTDPVASLDGEASIVGKALIIHADEDDLETQPTGDAGDRVACGIVTAR